MIMSCSSFTLFLAELLRSSGIEEYRIGSWRTAVLGPERFLFETFDIIRLCLCTSLIIKAMALGSPSTLGDCVSHDPNPDIAGYGVRVSTYILLTTVIVSLASGSFHSKQSGTKELGAAILISECN